MMRGASLVIPLYFLMVPASALAAGPVEVVISDAGQHDENGDAVVELRFLNGTDSPQPLVLPDRLEARLTAAQVSRTVVLFRIYGGAAPATAIGPGGFARARYRLRAQDEAADGALLSIPAWETPQVALAIRPAAPVAAEAAKAPDSPAGPVLANAAPPPADSAPGNDFISNLSAYQPIYAIYMPGTNSDARIQLSLKYQLFGSDKGENPAYQRSNGLYFGYTQRMFWDLGTYSMPFRNIDFQPELFYLTPSKTLANGISVGGQIGLRHESNGREDGASRSINSIYVSPMAGIPLQDGWRLSLAPSLSFYVGDRSDNPDIERYRGKLGLLAEIGRDDSWRLSTQSRFNPGTGKGAITADISYPLPRWWKDGPDFYLYGQGFTGYGENLLDYNRHVTRFRLGIALVR